MGIRNAAKAVIIKDGKILLIKCKNVVDENFFNLPCGAIYYDLPGGGQNHFEALTDALRREVLEETGHAIAHARLAAIYEEIAANEKYRKDYPEYCHKVHFVFVCRISDAPRVATAKADLGALCSEWIDLARLDEIVILPGAIKANLRRIADSDGIIYLGSEHV